MRTFHRRAGLFAAALLFLLYLPDLHAQDRAVAGYVLALRGNWYLSSQPARPLTELDRVRDGDTVRAGPGNNLDGSLSLATYDRDTLVQLRCSHDGRCDSLPVQARVPRGRLGAILPRLPWSRPRERFTFARTRGTLEFAEAVLTRGTAGLDVAPLLRYVAAGSEWEIDAAVVDTLGRPVGSFPFHVTWRPGTPARVPRDAVPGPGLYQMQAFYVNPAGTPVSTAAWVLVADEGAPGADEAVASFQSLAATLAEWRLSGSDLDERTLLRACLYELAFDAGQPPVLP